MYVVSVPIMGKKFDVGIKGSGNSPNAGGK